MNEDDIKEAIKKSIEDMLTNDFYLLEKSLSERSISHKLALHLGSHFKNHHIDCEYNGDVSKENGKKHIKMLYEQLDHLKLLTEKEQSEDWIELITRAVFPDIIIHERGDNKNNLCIIEVKKADSKRVFKEYDHEKLKAYTIQNNDSLKYKLGVYIEFNIGERYAKAPKIKFYKGGEAI